MTVRELIELLAGLPPDAEVVTGTAGIYRNVEDVVGDDEFPQLIVLVESDWYRPEGGDIAYDKWES